MYCSLAVFIISLFTCTVYTQNIHDNIYKNEFLALTQDPEYHGMFESKIIVTEHNEYKPVPDAKISSSLMHIQRDIKNYGTTSLFHRMMRFIIFSMDLIVITPENMPKLYAYIDGICKDQSMKTPMIFISRTAMFFNAFAKKLFWGCGNIIIGQSVILESSDAALEAVVAHELGHIKYNHVNKILAVSALTHIATFCGLPFLLKKPSPAKIVLIAHLLNRLIIGKQFEKEADEFAYKIVGKGDGLVEFFELLETKDAEYEQGFEDTYALLQQDKDSLSFLDYIRLTRRYYATRALDYIAKAYKWLYHNTFFGEHPSCEARIQAVHNYEETEKQIIETHHTQKKCI